MAAPTLLNRTIYKITSVDNEDFPAITGEIASETIRGIRIKENALIPKIVLEILSHITPDENLWRERRTIRPFLTEDLGSGSRNSSLKVIFDERLNTPLEEPGWPLWTHGYHFRRLSIAAAQSAGLPIALDALNELKDIEADHIVESLSLPAGANLAEQAREAVFLIQNAIAVNPHTATKEILTTILENGFALELVNIYSGFFSRFRDLFPTRVILNKREVETIESHFEYIEPGTRCVRLTSAAHRELFRADFDYENERIHLAAAHELDALFSMLPKLAKRQLKEAARRAKQEARASAKHARLIAREKREAAKRGSTA